LDPSYIDRREAESCVDLPEQSVSLSDRLGLKLDDTALASSDRTGKSL
jgi:hypothetical protein